MKRVKPCILLCGYVGVGKTSIAQYYCGKEVVPDSAIGHGSTTTLEFSYYQSQSLDIWDYRGFGPGESIDVYIDTLKKFAKKCFIDNGLTKCPHIILYCIQGPGGRVTAADLDILGGIPLPTIAVITKSDITRPQQRKALKQRLTASGVNPSDIKLCSSSRGTGFIWLTNRIRKRQPEAEKRLEELKKECFIATTVFKSSTCYEVMRFRYMRDTVLLPTVLGRYSTYVYYTIGPVLAGMIAKRERLLTVIKWILTILVSALPKINTEQLHEPSEG